MVSREQMGRCAQRYDTVVSLAFCRALGIEPNRNRLPNKVKAPRHRKRKYRGIKQAMRQTHGVRQDLA